VLATHAGHYVHHGDPALLVDAIHRVVFPGIPRQLRETLASGGDVGEAYRTLARRYPPERFDEGLLNTLGYELLREERVDDAVAVFELNVAEYPDAANPYDSLGDGYSAAGRLEEAQVSYARAVEVAEQTGHPNLPTYRANLERVTQQFEQR
jgi:Flp pilus assembly protein TadD